MRCKYCHNPDTWEFSGGKEYSAEEVLAEILKYKRYISDGGVTLSGGEPMAQAEFAAELFALLKKEGLHTALDTSGCLFKESEVIDRLIDNTDLVLLDIKHIDDEEHKKLTRFSNKNTLEFAKYLSRRGKDMWIRHVLVSGITDNDEYLEKLKKFISGLKTVKKVEVLPYHTMGEVKYEKLNLDYPLKGLKPPTRERIQSAEKILKIGNTDKEV